MNISSTKIILNLFGLLLTFVTGVILTKTGKPYNVVIQTLHKLSSIGFFIIVIVTCISLLKDRNLLTISQIFIFLTMIFFALSIISGGLVLALKNVNIYILYSHRILPFLGLTFGIITCILTIIKK
ncbi:MAG: hypothetical protein NUV32_09150 [Exilispira sp.]|jgi:hypothetical protein|nr:hypothetical protein [Exilispira sp.]